MKSSKWNLTMLALAVCAIIASCHQKAKDSKEIAADENKIKFDKTDEKKDAAFAVKVADIGHLEVALGELAGQNSTTAKVKEYGQMMVVDHGKSNEELKSLATQKDISLPDAMSDDLQKKYDKLVPLQGHEFDKAYCDMMVNGHKDALELFKKEAEKGSDPDIQNWAAKKIAVLEHHLQMARECDQAVARK